MSTQTITQHQAIIKVCKSLFEKKNKDYDTSWRVLRLPSCTDQILIKAQRIRTIQEKGTQKIEDPIETELIGIINYSLIALIQLELAGRSEQTIPYEELSLLYDRCVGEIQQLMAEKNHDYSEIWRDMRVSSLIDIILMKLLRIKQIENNAGNTLVSEGVKANYQDIVNYAVFALIQEGYLEKKEQV